VKFIYGSINTGTLAQLAPDRWLKPHRTDGFAASEYSIPISKFLIHFTWSLTRGLLLYTSRPSLPVSEYFSDYSTLSAHGLNPPVGHVAPMRGYGALNSCPRRSKPGIIISLIRDRDPYLWLTGIYVFIDHFR